MPYQQRRMEQLVSTISHLDLINIAKRQLSKSRGDVTRSDLFKLLAHKYLHCSVQKLRLARSGELAISEQVIAGFQTDISKLLQDYPFAYVIGETDFFDATYKCQAGVLIPRPDSEVLVEECLSVMYGMLTYRQLSPLNICEIGVGSGALLAAIASHFIKRSDEEVIPDLRLFATDINPLAITLATENFAIQNIKVQLFNCDLLPELHEGMLKMGLPFDVLYSNPPYISEAEWANLSESVKTYEPTTALLATENGLNFYRRILDIAPRYLRKDGYLLFEHGYAQKPALTKLLQTQKYADYKIKKWRQDYHAQDRVLVVQYCPSDYEN